jgi:hypothetical protein
MVVILVLSGPDTVVVAAAVRQGPTVLERTAAVDRSVHRRKVAAAAAAVPIMVL